MVKIFFNYTFLTGLAIRLLAIVIAIPLMQENWFLPFVSTFLSQFSFDPWSSFIETGGDPLAYPYGPVMLLAHSIGAGLGLVIDVIAGTSTFFAIGYKTTLLAADICCLILLDKLFPNKTNKLLFLYWLSPIVLVAIYWMGRSDIIPISLFVLALYCLKNNKFKTAALWFGLAVGAKFSMGAGLPFFLLYLWKNKRLNKFFSGATITLLCVIAITHAVPLLSPGFLTMVISTPEVNRMVGLSLSVGRGVEIYVAPLLFLLAVYFVWRLPRFSFELLMAFLGVSFFVILLVTPAPINWYVWLLPFLVFHQLSADRQQIFFAQTFSVLVVIYHLFNFQGPSIPSLGTIIQPLSAYYFGPNILLDHSVWATGIVSIGLVVMLQMLRENIQRNDSFRLSRKPILIGICGDSGTGKDRLFDSLADIFGRTSVLQISGDDYHSWDRHAPMWKALTHLNPRANKLDKLSQDVISVLAGHIAARQSYDHSSGRFISSRQMENNDVVIVSGLHVLFDPELVRRYDVSIFLEPSDDLKKFWKIKRDVTMRGWKVENVVATLERRTEDSKRYIEPQKDRADLIFRMVPVNEENLKQAISDENYAIDIPCRLHVTMKSGLYWESLVKVLVGVCGLHVDIDFPAQPGFVEVEIEGDVDAEDIALGASNLAPALTNLIDVSPSWQTGMLGVMQLISMVQIDLALRRRL